MSYRQIGAKLERNHTSVGTFLKNYEKTGDYHQKSGRGRKRVTTASTDDKIVRAVKRRRTTTAQELKSQFNLDVSLRTIRRRLNEFGFSSTFQIKKHFVREKNREWRLRWAHEHVNWSIDQWKSVLWSDESPFVLRYAGRQRVWRLANERYKVQLLKGIKHDKQINVWGCFSWYGVGHLYRIHGIMKATNYKQILIHHMIPSANELFDDNFIFQQDNDPKHTARITKKYLKNKKVNVLKWPSQSLDLNPIENLWSIFDKQMKNRTPSNESELFDILNDGWQNLSIELLQSLVESMPRRCQAVIDANGQHTKY